MKAGEPFNVKPTGPSDIRRIEGAIFNWGADMTYENNPFELGLDRLVDDLPEEASISIRALKAIKADGVDRKINGVEIDGDPFPALNNMKWTVNSAVGRSARSPPRSTRRAWAEHRLRVAAGGAVRRSARRSRSRPSGARARPRSWRCPSWTRQEIPVS